MDCGQIEILEEEEAKDEEHIDDTDELPALEDTSMTAPAQESVPTTPPPPGSSPSSSSSSDHKPPPKIRGVAEDYDGIAEEAHRQMVRAARARGKAMAAQQTKRRSEAHKLSDDFANRRAPPIESSSGDSSPDAPNVDLDQMFTDIGFDANTGLPTDAVAAQSVLEAMAGTSGVSTPPKETTVSKPRDDWPPENRILKLTPAPAPVGFKPAKNVKTPTQTTTTSAHTGGSPDSDTVSHTADSPSQDDDGFTPVRSKRDKRNSSKRTAKHKSRKASSCTRLNASLGCAQDSSSSSPSSQESSHSKNKKKKGGSGNSSPKDFPKGGKKNN